MAKLDEELALARESRARHNASVKELYASRDWTQAERKMLAEAAGFSVQTIKDLVAPEVTAPRKLTVEMVKQCLEQIRDGEVTKYKDIGIALGFTDYWHPVSNLLTRETGIAALAAPVIGADGNAHQFKPRRKFKVGGIKVNRDEYLDQRGVKFEVSSRDDEYLLIDKSQYVSGETLKQRLAALNG